MHCGALLNYGRGSVVASLSLAGNNIGDAGATRAANMLANTSGQRSNNCIVRPRPRGPFHLNAPAG
jgi:hypothetical protein